MKLPAGFVPGVGVVQATARGGLGERLLKRMGWVDGAGLGVGGRGRATALEVAQRRDNAGVGVDAAAPAVDWGDHWWEASFAAAAAAVAAVGVRAAASSSSSSDSDDDGEVAGMAHRDGVPSTAPREQAALAARLARGPTGRFGGRVGKMERVRRQEAAMAEAARARLDGGAHAREGGRAAAKGGGSGAAPLRAGAAPAAAQASAAAPPLPAAAHPTPVSTKKDAKAKRKAGKAAQREAEAAKRSKTVAPAPPPPPPPTAPAPATPPQEDAGQPSGAPLPGWWGASIFVHAGRLGGVGDPPAARPRSGFDEGDQEAVATRAHGAKAVGRRGLGTGSGPPKVGGTRWAGARTTFDDDDGGGGGGGAGAGAAPLPAAAAQDAPSGASKAGKLKKLAAAELAAAPRARLRLGTLARRVARASGAAVDDVVARLQASSRFAVDAKGRVSRAAG